jgi:hypothetical protein
MLCLRIVGSVSVPYLVCGVYVLAYVNPDLNPGLPGCRCCLTLMCTQISQGNPFPRSQISHGNRLFLISFKWLGVERASHSCYNVNGSYWLRQ